MSDEEIKKDVHNRIAFHKTWRRIWSITYFAGASATIICSAFATASAGMITSTGEGKLMTMGLALAATILSSLEKVLKMREKWDLHRNSQQAFEIVRLRILANSIDSKAIVDRIEGIVQSYSAQLGDLSNAPTNNENGE